MDSSISDPNIGIGVGVMGVAIAVLFYAAVVAFTLWVAWLVIRSAVRRALWEHSSGIGRPKKLADR